MRNIITESFYKYYDKGWFEEYSDEHLLIKALNGDMDFYHKHNELVESGLYGNGKNSENTGLNFITNLGMGLERLENVFGEEKLKKFVEDQMSAGKENYNEEQFIRALSELHVLRFLTTFTNLKKAEYEPRVGSGGTNPEARLYIGDEIFDIEVKTPGFSSSVEEGKKYLKCNLILSKLGRSEIKGYCKMNKFNIIEPRVLKLKDFIKSAATKFTIPNSKHHNILYINWTYTDFHYCGLNEVISLLNNPVSGILNNLEAAKLIGIKKEELEKISGIVLYRDNVNTLLFSDFRYQYERKTFRFLINPMYVKYAPRITKVIQMNASNMGELEYYPVDIIEKDLTENKLVKYTKDILEILERDIEFYRKKGIDIPKNILKYSRIDL